VKVTVLGHPRGSAGLAPRVAALCQRLGRELGLRRSTLSVLLTDDAGIRDYNRRFRRRDEATDVLSFPAGSGNPADQGHYLGDLVISVERAASQAREHGHEPSDEVEVLVLHGVLHLLGHDHEADEGQMREVEERLARKLFGSARGLIARTEGA
jgi:probable rRNA maturation factor